ncbi:hypothetical protein APED_22655 [Acanthopleuribacter pedis]
MLGGVESRNISRYLVDILNVCERCVNRMSVISFIFFAAPCFSRAFFVSRPRSLAAQGRRPKPGAGILPKVCDSWRRTCPTCWAATCSKNARRTLQVRVVRDPGALFQHLSLQPSARPAPILEQLHPPESHTLGSSLRHRGAMWKAGSHRCCATVGVTEVVFLCLAKQMAGETCVSDPGDRLPTWYRERIFFLCECAFWPAACRVPTQGEPTGTF